MKTYSWWMAGLLVSLAATFAAAQEKTIDVAVETVLTGLDNPCGIAIQPGTGHVLISDSAAGRVVRLAPSGGGKAEDVITGFAQDIYGKGPMYKIGPLGLAFLDQKTLVVGGGDLPDGSELVRIYELPADGKPVTSDSAKHKLGPLAPSDQTKLGEGNFYGVAVSATAIYVTCNGDDTKGWVAKADLTGGTPGDLKPFIATKVATEVDAPVGITMHPGGRYLAVGQMGEINVPKDSLLTFYGPKSGKLLMNLPTGLFDIAGLAYSQSGRLYAVDFAWMDSSQGGLFRLDKTLVDGKQGMEAVKVLSLDKPTALAFAPDGTLYVTVFGTAAEGSTEKPGQLLKIVGDDL